MTVTISRCARRFVPALGLFFLASLCAANPASQGPTAVEVSPLDFAATTSGLKYRVLRKSSGRQPTAADTVVVHYRGWLDGNGEFDSSYKRNQPLTFPLANVIKGWTEGIQLVGEGGMIELEIPPQLGYADRGIPGVIPPHATLHFVVELIQIK